MVWLGAFDELDKIKKPSRIFVGSTFELFHDIVKEALPWILSQPKKYLQHTFIFLTKQPQNLIKWSPFPDNCWVGVSATDIQMADSGLCYLYDIDAKIKFLSIEPLLDWNHTLSISFPKHLDWLIIGQQTPVRKSTMPRSEWIKEIVMAADKANIPVFIKNNMNSCEIADYPELLDKNGNLRQEFPKES
jgi:protein gp37